MKNSQQSKRSRKLPAPTSVASSGGLAVLVSQWNSRARELLRAGEREQAGIYQVCAFQLQQVLESKSAANKD